MVSDHAQQPLPDREALAKTIQQFWQGPSGRAWDDGEKSCCEAFPRQADWFRRLADHISSTVTSTVSHDVEKTEDGAS